MARSTPSLLIFCYAALACSQGAPLIPGEKTAESIYATVIDAALFQHWGDSLDLVRNRPATIWLTEAPSPEDFDRDADTARAWLLREMPGLPTQLAESYVAPSPASWRLPERIVSRVPLQHVSLDSLRGSCYGPVSRWALIWRTIRPKAHMTLSEIWFTSDSTEALVEVSTCQAALDAVAFLVWLQWTLDGWLIRGATMSWIS